jgi:hypothetical protein
MSDEAIGRREARRLIRKAGMNPDASDSRGLVRALAKRSLLRAKSKLRDELDERERG